MSPLSWWNDAFINLPIAWAFGSLVSLISRRLFIPATIIGYWLTNIAGLLMMARGTAGVIGDGSKRNGKRRILLSLAAGTAYTLLILLLFHFGILNPLRR